MNWYRNRIDAIAIDVMASTLRKYNALHKDVKDRNLIAEEKGFMGMYFTLPYQVISAITVKLRELCVLRERVFRINYHLQGQPFFSISVRLNLD
jgi:hypothetical protein